MLAQSRLGGSKTSTIALLVKLLALCIVSDTVTKKEQKRLVGTDNRVLSRSQLKKGI